MGMSAVVDTPTTSAKSTRKSLRQTVSDWLHDSDLRGWFQLIVISILFPVCGSIYAYYNQAHERQLSNDRLMKDQQIADDNLHETELENYIDHMVDLQFKQSTVVATSTPFGVENIATTYTDNILRQLGPDGARKAIVIQ